MSHALFCDGDVEEALAVVLLLVFLKVEVASVCPHCDNFLHQIRISFVRPFIVGSWDQVKGLTFKDEGDNLLCRLGELMVVDVDEAFFHFLEDSLLLSAFGRLGNDHLDMFF